MGCDKWEKLILLAEREKNTAKSLEFREKLVECVVYTLQEKVNRGKIRDVDNLIKYGREMAKKFAIEELNFHLSLLEKQIEKVGQRKTAQTK